MNLQTFAYSNRLAVDTESPIMTCSFPAQRYVNTDPGKATAVVEWDFQVTDNSLDVDPNAVVQVQSSHQSGQEFPIGHTSVRITATDQAGSMDLCVFLVNVIGN